MGQVRADGVPLDGNWPCQQPTSIDFPVLTAFLYRLLRDGAPSPGDVENHAIQAGKSATVVTAYTNPHLLCYARSLVSHLTAPGSQEG